MDGAWGGGGSQKARRRRGRAEKGTRRPERGGVRTKGIVPEPEERNILKGQMHDTKSSRSRLSIEKGGDLGTKKELGDPRRYRHYINSN